MSRNTTYTSTLRSGPKGVGVYAGSVQLVAEISFDPILASTDTGVKLPSGAIVTDVVTDGGATGGISPTVDIGTSTDPDGFVNEGDADLARNSNLAKGTLGVLAYTALAADTSIFAGVGASAATGGTVTAKIFYYRQDDTSGLNH